MTAADGKNTNACVDGTCEVFVSPGAQFRQSRITDQNLAVG
jgi:hypothetical protein